MTHLTYAVALAGLMALVALGTVRTGLLLRTWVPARNLLLSAADNLARLVMLGICLLIGARLGPGPATLGWATSGLAEKLLWGAAAGLVLSAGLALAGRLVADYYGEAVYSDRLVQCILPIDAGEWAGVVAAFLPAAALEELLFRSLPLGGLGWLVPAWWLMWPLALFFGLLHWPQGPWGVVGTCLAGIALSTLFLTSGSIWPPLAAHYVMNVSQVALAKGMGIKPLRAGGER